VSLSIDDLFVHSVDLVCKLAKIELRQFLTLQLLDKSICVFLINVVLQPLDVAFVLLHSLPQGLNIVGKRLRLRLPPVFNVDSTFSGLLQCALQVAKLLDVALLDLRILYLDYVQLFFVLLCALSESIGELVRLL